MKGRHIEGNTKRHARYLQAFAKRPGRAITACIGKRAFPSKSRALVAARQLGPDLEAYRCSVCACGWHIGHPGRSLLIERTMRTAADAGHDRRRLMSIEEQERAAVMARRAEAGARLRSLREAASWSLLSFARAMMVEPRVLARYERGEVEPPAELLAAYRKLERAEVAS